MAKETPIERMMVLASKDFLTLTELAEVACVGINKAASIRVKLIMWMKEDGRYPYIDSSKLLTSAVFEFLGLSITKYTGGNLNAQY